MCAPQLYVRTRRTRTVRHIKEDVKRNRGFVLLGVDMVDTGNCSAKKGGGGMGLGGYLAKKTKLHEKKKNRKPISPEKERNPAA